MLLTAVSCEIKIKDALLFLAKSDQRPLVEWLLESPRDFSVAAVALFDNGLKSICGRSLREDDRFLFKCIQRLFEARNRVAHRGAEISYNDVAIHVNMANAAFAYLDRVAKGLSWTAVQLTNC